MSDVQSYSTYPTSTPDLRVCLRPPIPEIAIAAGYLNDAVNAHLDGRFSEAENLLERANILVINEWSNSILGKYSEYNTPRFRLSLPPIGSLPKEKARMPSSESRRLLHSRDGNHCRFCGIPVIRRQVRKRLVSLYPKVVRWGPGNAVKHAAVSVMEAQYDHIVPHSKGGRSDLDNLVLTCAPCNYGRVAFTLEEMGLFDPRKRNRVECVFSDWDGLERLLQ